MIRLNNLTCEAPLMSPKQKKSRRIKHDINFVPYPEEQGDEFFPNGVFVFNITRVQAYLDGDECKISPGVVRVEDCPRYSSSLDESYVHSADLQKPVILAEIAPGRYNLIDGHHRMEKARRMAWQQLPCYRLAATEHIRFLTTRKGYDAYVDYWNDKLE